MSDSNRNQNNSVFFSSGGRGVPIFRENPESRSMSGNTDFVVIAPECIMLADESVIAYKGAQYYRSCDEFVSDLPDGGQSFCVKRTKHPGNLHEDYSGRTRSAWDSKEV